jgi:hypothetical protein
MFNKYLSAYVLSQTCKGIEGLGLPHDNLIVKAMDISDLITWEQPIIMDHEKQETQPQRKKKNKLRSGLIFEQ